MLIKEDVIYLYHSTSKFLTLKQRFHNWLHRRIANLTEMKWSDKRGKVVYVNPRGTSSYAYDGSDKLKRNKDNYELAAFASGKRYNCDLSASYNIGARFIYSLGARSLADSKSAGVDRGDFNQHKKTVSRSSLYVKSPNG